MTINTAAYYTPYFYIWGLQWIILAIGGEYITWSHEAAVAPISTWAAIAASLAAALFSLFKSEASRKDGFLALRRAVPLFGLLWGGWLLTQIEAVDLFFSPLFDSIILAGILLQFGFIVQRMLVALGIWLLVIITVTAIWFLGYSPIIAHLFGGLSMIICGWIVQTSKHQTHSS